MIEGWLGALFWVMLAAAAVAALSTLTWRSWRRFARKARGPVTMALPKTGPLTPLDALFAPLEAGNPGKSGILALIDNPDAYAARAHSARMAGRSLDLMYYIWRTDLTGWLLIEELLEAASRGVRVRLLLDDVNVQGFDRAFLALNQHPNVEVRLFNPTRNRGHVARRSLEMLLGLSRFNRRMHNKAWIADGRLAIVGGRNIGDTYYDAEESGLAMSRDADVMLTGPVVAEVEGLFDSYWNLGLALPILTLWPEFKVNVHAFRRRMARHNRSPHARSFLARTLQGRDPAQLLTSRLRWTDRVTLLADPPDKALGHRSGPWMGEAITALLREAKEEVRLVTPYFVPGNDGCDLLTGIARMGVRLSILTNALSVTDMVLVHGAYRHYRLPLLKAGARLFEFGPLPRATGRRDLLHTKVFLIDGRQAVVGSLNFDLRSAFMNTELGVLFEEPDVFAELSTMFDRQCAPDQAHCLSLERGRLRWSVIRGGENGVARFEPDSPVVLRAVSWVVGHLPIQSYL
ncbi:phospholipase D family protein [Cereibacter sphaeroides]|uniref:phospholipase D-like domain-containing protein n=1 Tax=Cereibacter sphaeroides TaxID=1063 RepID=UPI001F3DDF99|nr:phospholipase D family protein [Cereibacter sphaeroides]MCE6949822.1 phospholipase D family protein [Cereibacter sphaeroides]MCE6958980.1 phospholipase D family protein [Cereibacter sphaeroides]MCE6973678.1 phospholipase D family protein [Cereibacter sphaeroides]